MADLETAIAIATRAHKGQKDKSGQPYILHPLRVMMKQTNDIARQVAVLHDVVEDTEVTLQFLDESGFSYDVLFAVELLTRKPSENYAEYLRRVMAHPVACSVKRADLEDNMDIRRLPENLSEADLQRLQKYRGAWEIMALAETVTDNPLKDL
ncbi:GTP pyrophosphokinase [Magnetococcus sp. PR-3]|uniref:GTP pyrophosphokinase n=1 Tax=Magnetococcus sp. PR-3 TaxID=3120355 RepID=UPI002FCE54E9